MKLSVVTTMFQSAPHLREFYAHATAAARRVTDDYEFVLVNDGSPDDVLDIALSLHEADARVVVIDLSRNFGHHKAMMTGLAHARGDLVFLIDCDLEVAPGSLPDFHARQMETRADVVYGVQDARQDSLASRFFAHLYYRAFNWLASVPLPCNLVTARLMTKRYVAALVEHREREVMIAGLWALTGFEQVAVRVLKASKGASSYDVGRKIAVAVNAITSFSNKPLIFVFYLGTLISVVAALAALYLVARGVFGDGDLSGWPSLMVSIWLLGGITIFSVGLVGIYLSKVFMETKQRPYTIVRHLYRKVEPS